MFSRTPTWDRDWCDVILDIATMSAAVTRDWAAARALPYHVIRNPYCKIVYVVWDNMIAPLPIKCMSRPWWSVKVTPIDAATPTWLYVYENFWFFAKRCGGESLYWKGYDFACMNCIHREPFYWHQSSLWVQTISLTDLDFFQLKSRYLKVYCLVQSFIWRATGLKILKENHLLSSMPLVLISDLHKQDI